MALSIPSRISCRFCFIIWSSFLFAPPFVFERCSCATPYECSVLYEIISLPSSTYNDTPVTVLSIIPGLARLAPGYTTVSPIGYLLFIFIMFYLILLPDVTTTVLQTQYVIVVDYRLFTNGGNCTMLFLW